MHLEMETTGARNTENGEIPENEVKGNENNRKIYYNGSLMWIRGKINNQFIDMLLDSGATMSCIANRCVTASPYLKNLTRHPYIGPGLLDVNGNPLSSLFEIRAPLVIGNPRLSIDVKFIVVDNLPYSCIIGMNFLKKLDFWGVDNKTGYLNLNKSTCPVFTEPQVNTNICLVSQNRCVILPGEMITIATTPKGTGMNAFRPITDITFLTEGKPELEKRTNILVVPALNFVSHKNCTNIPVTVKNNSSQKATIGRGSKIAMCSDEYDYFRHDICSIGEKDPIDFLCSNEKLGHLTEGERCKVKNLLSKYKHIFSLSNSHIGRTSINEFDIHTDDLYPVADSLRCVPLHKEGIVKELLQKYENLDLIEKMDSPFRASTVLIAKKMWPIV